MMARAVGSVARHGCLNVSPANSWWSTTGRGPATSSTSATPDGPVGMEFLLLGCVLVPGASRRRRIGLRARADPHADALATVVNGFRTMQIRPTRIELG
jgi:hypothetical protein